MARTALLVALFLASLGCQQPDPEAINSLPTREPCGSVVTLYVVNDNAGDIRLTFGSQERLKTAGGLQTTTYRVPKARFTRPIGVEVVRGGLSTRERVPTEPITCDEATLKLTDPLHQSIFFGADVRSPYR